MLENFTFTPYNFWPCLDCQSAKAKGQITGISPFNLSPYAPLEPTKKTELIAAVEKLLEVVKSL